MTNAQRVMQVITKHTEMYLTGPDADDIATLGKLNPLTVHTTLKKLLRDNTIIDQQSAGGRQIYLPRLSN